VGSHCSVDKQINNNNETAQDKSNLNQTPNSSTLKTENLTISQCLTFKTYKEYNIKIDIFKRNLSSLIKKVVVLNEFSVSKDKHRQGRRLLSSYHKNKSLYTIEKLYDVLSSIFHRINSVFGTSYGFPKQELAKLNYDLITRYLAYEDDTTSDEAENVNVSNKVIKRINFFTEEFPFKLSRIENTVKSQKIYVFGYDIDYRVTFYIKPHYGESGNNKNVRPGKGNSKGIGLNTEGKNSQGKDNGNGHNKTMDNITIDDDSIKMPYNRNIFQIKNKSFFLEDINAKDLDQIRDIGHNVIKEDEDVNKYTPKRKTDFFNKKTNTGNNFFDNLNNSTDNNNSSSNSRFNDFSILNFDKDKSAQPCYPVENMDYIVYMFFIVESILPFLKEKYSFSEQVNIVLDLEDHPVDNELIKMVLYYFNLMHPLILNKLCIVNASSIEVGTLGKGENNYFDSKKDKQSGVIIEKKRGKNAKFSSLQSLNAQMKEDNKFNSLVLCDSDFKLKILKYYNPNCVPMEYGGYHMINLDVLNEEGVDSKEVRGIEREGYTEEEKKKNVEGIMYFDELAEHFLSNILVKEIY